MAAIVPGQGQGGSSTTDHTALSNIGTNTHAQIDTAIGTIFSKVGDTLTGTAGSGFFGAIPQSSAPSTPGSGFRIYANASGLLEWKGTNGFTQTFDGSANTANRAYTLPDSSGTIAVEGSLTTFANPSIQNGYYRFVQTTAPTQRSSGVPLVTGDRWHKPTDNGISGTAGDWVWSGSDWVSANVFSLSIPVVNGNFNNQTIRSESVGTNLGIRVSGLASQIAVVNAAPTSSNYWTAAVSVSGTAITTLSTQNATTYPHNYSTPNTIIPARTAIPVGGPWTATALGQTSRNWSAMTRLGTDVYACVESGDIYKQTNGTGNFVGLGQASRLWYAMTTLGTDVYACVLHGDIYKQTNGTGSFVGLGQISRAWLGMTTLGTDVYASAIGGDIYKQTNGTGNFVGLQQQSRNWVGMTTLGTDVYASVYGGDIYKQTNGTGNFVELGQQSRNWRGMTPLGTDVYACVEGGDIYKQTNGTGNFVGLGQASRLWHGMTTLGTDVYACVLGGDIYVLNPEGVTSIGHSLKVVLVRTGSVSLPYVSITANCQVIHP